MNVIVTSISRDLTIPIFTWENEFDIRVVLKVSQNDVGLKLYVAGNAV
jgi:hypothetical protein